MLNELTAKEQKELIEQYGGQSATNNINVAKHVSIANILLQTLHLNLYNKQLYVYDNGIYKNNDLFLQKKILETDINATERTRVEIMKYLKVVLSENEVQINTDYITFKNGIFNTKNKELVTFNPLIFTINKVNANYNENLSINNDIDKFLNDVTNNNPKRKNAILQIIGYCMTMSTSLQKAFIFYGRKAENGKSTLIELINTLIGEENVCHIKIHELQEKFYISEIENKLLNSVGENPTIPIKSIDVFKNVVDVPKVTIEKKFQNRYTIFPYAKYIFALNELPIVSDTTNGYYRRLNILKFEAQFTEEDKLKFDKSKLFTQEALDYLAYVSLQEYLKLINTRQFANEEESISIIGRYKIENNSVLSYLDDTENLERLFSGWTTVKPKIMYEDYKWWCKETEYKNEGRNKFYLEVLETGKYNKKTLNGLEYFEKVYHKTENPP